PRRGGAALRAWVTGLWLIRAHRLSGWGRRILAHQGPARERLSIASRRTGAGRVRRLPGPYPWRTHEANPADAPAAPGRAAGRGPDPHDRDELEPAYPRPAEDVQRLLVRRHHARLRDAVPRHDRGRHRGPAGRVVGVRRAHA